MNDMHSANIVRINTRLFCTLKILVKYIYININTLKHMFECIIQLPI